MFWCIGMLRLQLSQSDDFAAQLEDSSGFSMPIDDTMQIKPSLSLSQSSLGYGMTNSHKMPRNLSLVIDPEAGLQAGLREMISDNESITPVGLSQSRTK